MMYEYKFKIVFSEDKLDAIQMGLTDLGSVHNVIEETINQMAVDGWEPIPPFQIPIVWFRREKA